MFFTYKHYRDTIDGKQSQRLNRINNLKKQYNPNDISKKDEIILNLSAEESILKLKEGEFKTLDILSAYSKLAIKAHEKINCLTELLVSPELLKDIEIHVKEKINQNAPLAGFPISLKDTVSVAGFDSCIGYTKKAFHPYFRDSPLITLLKDAGAIPFVKTNVPITLLSFESYNDVWGRTDNPHVSGYSPGGSTGGESALIAFGGSRLGIGTDVAGSVRVPAHFSGIYTIRCTSNRFPKAGNSTSLPGQEGIPSVYSPMTRSLKDLKFFFKTIIDMSPWKYDYTVLPIPYKTDDENSVKNKPIKIGVIHNDGIVPPSPACSRALNYVEKALKNKSNSNSSKSFQITLQDFVIPKPVDALRIASQLLVGDAGKTATRDFSIFDHNDIGVKRFFSAARLPKIFKYIYYLWVKYIRRDDIYASLVKDWNEKSVSQYWELIAERESYRELFYKTMQEQNIDFLITVPNSTPAFPHNALYDTFSACGYTFIFNLLDYPAGVLPVTKVDKKLDKLPNSFDINKLNSVGRGAYMHYNAEKMHGLPVGVQVIGKRLEEEKVLSLMEIIESALHDIGIEYNQLNLMH